LKRLIPWLAVLFMGVACAPPHLSIPRSSPELGSVTAGTLALYADEVKAAALAEDRADALAEVFSGRALNLLETQVQRFSANHLHLQERERSVLVVFFDAATKEVVLEVRAFHRLVTPTSLQPPWAATVRQWWARLEFIGGRWWVGDQADLPPDQWRAA
jgi:hypothetical protein